MLDISTFTVNSVSGGAYWELSLLIKAKSSHRIGSISSWCLNLCARAPSRLRTTTWSTTRAFWSRTTCSVSRTIMPSDILCDALDSYDKLWCWLLTRFLSWTDTSWRTSTTTGRYNACHTFSCWDVAHNLHIVPLKGAYVEAFLHFVIINKFIIMYEY